MPAFRTLLAFAVEFGSAVGSWGRPGCYRRLAPILFGLGVCKYGFQYTKIKVVVGRRSVEISSWLVLPNFKLKGACDRGLEL